MEEIERADGWSCHEVLELTDRWESVQLKRNPFGELHPATEDNKPILANQSTVRGVFNAYQSLIFL